jgi:hypothetical protein
MMAIAQGIKKQTIFKKQTALGTAASGSGGQLLRRTTSVLEGSRDTYAATEIATHQQSTGVTLGVFKPKGKITGILSPKTYASFFQSLLSSDFAAVTPITGLTLTIGGTAGAWTITDTLGTAFLTGGIKIGDVLRLSGANLAAGNVAKNLLVTGVTSTVITCMVLNGSALTTESSKASSTVTVIGKKSKAPLTGHTNDYYTLEEWYSDISRSEVFADMKVSAAAVTVPATGLCTAAFDFVGAASPSRTGAQVLTTPTAETTTPIVSAVTGAIIANGVSVGYLTGANFTISNNANVEAVVGSNHSPDIFIGRTSVSGSFTAMFSDGALQALFDAESTFNLVIVLPADATTASEFVSFSMSKVKLTSDTPDDGEKSIVRTYAFTAEINGDGGAVLANDQTILSIQDSAL